MTGPGENPYARFLGLPDEGKPPHLYALLDLELFCSQPERIGQAVRKQFRRIKRYEDHPDRATREGVQDIMNHIATASVVLTDPRRKEEYDIGLAEDLGVDREAILESRLAVPLPEYELTVTAGPSLVSERMPLLTDRPITVGSDPACAVALASSRAASLHFQLRYVDGQWLFEQTGEAQTSLVNDQRTRAFVLADGDAIDAGGYRFRFTHVARAAHRLDTPAPAPPPISLTLQAGPSVPDPNFAALPPERILIGHCDTALWQLADPLVSRHHCRIEPLGEDWSVVDLRSTNGTFINGCPLSHPAVLRHRDALSLGRFEILVSFRW